MEPTEKSVYDTTSQLVHQTTICKGNTDMLTHATHSSNLNVSGTKGHKERVALYDPKLIGKACNYGVSLGAR